MKKWFVLVVLLFSINLFGTAGAGPDIPTNITANGVTLRPNSNVTIGALSGNYNNANICWNTTQPSDTLVNFDYNVNGYSAPTTQRILYDATLVSHHCQIVDNIAPGKMFLINVASCGTAGTGGTSPLRCARYDLHWSVAPAGNQQANGMYVTIQMPPAGDTLSWKAFIAAPLSTYKGSPINADILPILVDGAVPNYIFVTSMTVDGQSCPAALPYSTCGSTNIQTLFTSSGAEVISSNRNNYGTLIPSSGTFSGDWGISGATDVAFKQPGCLWRFVTNSSTATGVHNAVISMQGADINQHAVGNPVTLIYSFTVNAAPTFSIITPTSPPSIPSLGSWNAVIPYGITAYETAKTKNLTAPGIYNNDNFSVVQTAIDPYDVSNYGGDRIAFNFAKYTNSISTAFQAGHAYVLGDLVKDSNNYVETVTTAGTSGSSLTCNTLPPQSCTSGAVTFKNIGNQLYWDTMAQRILMPVLNWETVMPYSSVWEEWNGFPHGTWMDFNIEGNTLTEDCDGSGHCTGLQLTALQHLVQPLINTAGISTQGAITFNYKFVPNGTIRGLPYGTNMLLGNWIVSGNQVVTGSVNEQLARVDLLLQSADEIMNYNPVESVSNPYPCCLSTPSFDLGLVTETLIEIWTQQHNSSVTQDPRIPVKLLQLADWFYKNEFNQTGSDFLAPYTLWFTPASSALGNYINNRQLNNLMAPTYAWLYAVYGNACTLPTASVSCLTAGDTMFQYGITQGFSNAKQFNQAFKGFYSYVGWRTGTIAGTSSDVTPDNNPHQGPFPNNFEPMPAGEFPNRPSYTQSNGNSINITWNNYERMVGTFIKYGTGTGNINTIVDCGPNSFIGKIVVWTSTCSTPQLPPGLYYYGVGGTDTQGNVSFSSSCVTCNGAPPWNFTVQSMGQTLNVSTVPLTVTIPQNSQGHINTVTSISGGFNAPVSLSVANQPAGVVFIFNPQTIPAPGCCNSATSINVNAGVPPGTYLVTMHADGGGLHATSTLQLTITATLGRVIVPTQNLAKAIVSQSYNATVHATGGLVPYTWSALRPLPVGLRLNINGAITGTPLVGGQYSISIKACDSEVPSQCGNGTANLFIIGATP